MSFHAVMHARSAGIASQGEIQIGNRVVRTLLVTADQATQTFEDSFENVFERLSRLPRMFIEPDGSFVWVVNDVDVRRQIDGSLYDDGTRVLHAELKGVQAEPLLDELFTAFGWPRQTLMFQLVQSGVYVAEDDFRRLAADDAQF